MTLERFQNYLIFINYKYMIRKLNWIIAFYAISIAQHSQKIKQVFEIIFVVISTGISFIYCDTVIVFKWFLNYKV